MMNDAENPLTNFKQTGENNETMSPSMIRAQRAIIGVIGVVFGLLTMAPNIMLNGYHHLAGEVGVTASISFIAGGIYGGMKCDWKWLLPGLFLQVLVLTLALGGLIYYGNNM